MTKNVSQGPSCKRVAKRNTHKMPSLPESIFASFSANLSQMTLTQIIQFTIRATLKQLTRDYEFDYKTLKSEYLEDTGVDYHDIDPPQNTGVVSKPTSGSKEPKAPVAGAPATSLSKMKKEELVAVCQTMGLSVDGTVPTLRQRIKDAGGLPGASTGGTKALPAPSKPKSKPLEIEEMAPVRTEKTKSEKAKAPSAQKAPSAPKTVKPPKAPLVEETQIVPQTQVLEPEEDEYEEETMSLQDRLKAMLKKHSDEPEEEDLDEDFDEDEDLEDQQETPPQTPFRG